MPYKTLWGTLPTLTSQAWFNGVLPSKFQVKGSSFSSPKATTSSLTQSLLTCCPLWKDFQTSSGSFLLCLHLASASESYGSKHKWSCLTKASIPQICRVSLFTHSHITTYFTSAAHSIGIISHVAFCVIFLQRLEAFVSTCPVHLYLLDTNPLLEVRTSRWILVKWVKREPVLNFTTSSCLHKLGQWLSQPSSVNGYLHKSHWPQIVRVII